MPPPPTPSRFRSILQVFVACLLSSVCAVNWLGLAAVLESAEKYYGRSDSVMNAITNLYLGVYCVTCMPCGYVVDRMGVRFAVLGGACSQAVGATLTALFGRNVWALVAGSVVAAAGQPLLVSTPAAFAQEYAPKWTSRATSVISVSNNLGSAVAYLAAPRIVTVGGVRAWLVVRALFAIFCFFLALLCLHSTATTIKKGAAVSGYTRDVVKIVLLRNPGIAILLLGYGLGQGAFWAWAEDLDAALIPTGLSQKKIGDLGAVVTVLASCFSVVVGYAVETPKAKNKERHLTVALGISQTAAAVSAFAIAASVRAQSFWGVAIAWMAFSGASTPVMPLGAELAATKSPPGFIGATLSALFVGAELFSTAMGFAIAGLKFRGAGLVASVAVVTSLAASCLLALLLPSSSVVSEQSGDHGVPSSDEEEAAAALRNPLLLSEEEGTTPTP